jgi:hypothetical protein
MDRVSRQNDANSQQSILVALRVETYLLKVAVLGRHGELYS